MSRAKRMCVVTVAPERIRTWGRGGTRPSQRAGNFFCRSTPFFGSTITITISRFGERFCDSLYSLVLCFSTHSAPPRIPSHVSKWGGHVPPVPYEVGADAWSWRRLLLTCAMSNSPVFSMLRRHELTS